jgi:hypothetical protein
MEFKRISDLNAEMKQEIYAEMVRQTGVEYANFSMAYNVQVAEAMCWASSRKGPAYWSAISSGQVEPSLN